MNPFDTMEVPTISPIEKTEQGKHKKKKIIILSLLSTFFLFLGIILVLFYEIFLSRITVPRAPQESTVYTQEACQSFMSSHLDCSVEWVSNKDNTSGKLITQSIKEGTKVKKETRIVLSYSLGPEEVTVPSLDGLTKEEAEKTLNNLGLRLGTIAYEDNSQKKEGSVLGSDIAAGTVVKNGTSINITVSSGSQTIPNFVGMTQELAKTELKKTFFNVEFVEEQSDEAPGIVIKQSQDAGSVSNNPNITLTISTAKEVVDIEVPDVLGKTSQEAQTILASLGFTKIKSIEVEAKEGLSGVIAIVPSAGQKVQSTETIVIISAKQK